MDLKNETNRFVRHLLNYEIFFCSDLSELSTLMSLEDYENYLKKEGIIDEDGCPNTTKPKTDA